MGCAHRYKMNMPIRRVAKLVRCPKCGEWIDFQVALKTLKCSNCEARLPKRLPLQIHHEYVAY